MKNCPFCAEEIQDAAIVCKHCGRELADRPKVKANQHPSYWQFTALSVVLPFVGIIVGIVYMCRPQLLDRKIGEHMIALSILMGILEFVFFIGIPVIPR